MRFLIRSLYDPKYDRWTVSARSLLFVRSSCEYDLYNLYDLLVRISIPLKSFYHAEQEANSEQMVWRTISSLEGLQSDILLTYATRSESIISSDELVTGNNIYYSSKLHKCLAYDSTLTIPSSSSIEGNLQLWYTALASDGVAVLGDISKIVPLSSKRFESIQYNADSLRFVFRHILLRGRYKHPHKHLFESHFKSDHDKSRDANG